MPDFEIIHEKLDQAVDVLEEKEIDLWITFVRETTHVGDPCLDLLLGLDLTWQSALMISRTGVGPGSCAGIGMSTGAPVASATPSTSPSRLSAISAPSGAVTVNVVASTGTAGRCSTCMGVGTSE